MHRRTGRIVVPRNNHHMPSHMWKMQQQNAQTYGPESKILYTQINAHNLIKFKSSTVQCCLFCCFFFECCGRFISFYCCRCQYCCCCCCNQQLRNGLVIGHLLFEHLMTPVKNRFFFLFAFCSMLLIHSNGFCSMNSIYIIYLITSRAIILNIFVFCSSHRRRLFRHILGSSAYFCNQHTFDWYNFGSSKLIQYFCLFTRTPLSCAWPLTTDVLLLLLFWSF